MVDSTQLTQPCPIAHQIAIYFITLHASLQSRTTNTIFDTAEITTACRGVKEVILQFITFQTGGILTLHAVENRALLELRIQVDVDFLAQTSHKILIVVAE